MTANSTYREAKLRSNGLNQVKMEHGKSSIRIILTFVFWQGLWVPMGKSRGQKRARFGRLWKPSGEVQNALILANRAII